MLVTFSTFDQKDVYRASVESDDKKGVAEQVQQPELNNVNTVSLTEDMLVILFTGKRVGIDGMETMPIQGRKQMNQG